MDCSKGRQEAFHVSSHRFILMPLRNVLNNSPSLAGQNNFWFKKQKQTNNI